MLLQVFSDIHMEFLGPVPEISKEAEVVVIAGDMHTSPSTAGGILTLLRQQTKIPIIYILGNHEFYYETWPEVIELYRKEAATRDVILLDNETTTIDDVRFIGSTLWSDVSKDSSVYEIQRKLNDYYTILKTPRGSITKTSYETFQPSDSIETFEKSATYIESKLTVPHDGPTVVVTHHGPSYAAVPEEHKDSDINAAFFSDLDDMILKYSPELWIYGHTHLYSDMILGKTRLLANPRGYPHERNKSFKKELLIDV